MAATWTRLAGVGRHMRTSWRILSGISVADEAISIFVGRRIVNWSSFGPMFHGRGQPRTNGNRMEEEGMGMFEIFQKTCFASIVSS